MHKLIRIWCLAANDLLRIVGGAREILCACILYVVRPYRLPRFRPIANNNKTERTKLDGPTSTKGIR